MLMLVANLLAALGGVLQVSACSFADLGISPIDEILRHLSRGGVYPVLPRPTSTENNAFVTPDLQRPLRALTGNDEPLLNVLHDHAAREGEDLCYWSFQGLPPPRGGPSLSHPFRGYWDVSDGHDDQDIEWVQAYIDTAVARLHSRIEQDGPVVGAMCSLGSVLTSRRCQNGRSTEKQCLPAFTNSSIAWPMAISIWKIGHQDLEATISDWRAKPNMHLPNIEWVANLPGSQARPWNGSMPKPGELNPPGMPGGPSWPISKDKYWGQPKIAKVVRCSDIPSKFRYNSELFTCDHLSDGTPNQSSADEAYAVWRSLRGVWPPTKQCADDLAALNQVLHTTGVNCSVGFTQLQKFLPNFDCDNSDFKPKFRDMCCSVCGGQPIPDVPRSPSPPHTAPYHCGICNHVYDAEKDGHGIPFEDLPASWRCPVCGAAKSAYIKTVSEDWVHAHEISV